VSWANQSAAMLRTLGILKDLNREAEKFSEGEPATVAAREPGEQINTPGDDTPSFMRMGGISGVRVRVEAAAQRVVKEAQESRAAVEKSTDLLTELFGQLRESERKKLEELVEIRNAFYSGSTLLKRASELNAGIVKALKAGKDPYRLMEELDKIIATINRNFLGDLRGLGADFFSNLRHRRGAGGTGNDGRSTGGNP
jgi:hypothetical protein